MNSFNVYGYRLKSTDVIAMKDITDFRDMIYLTGLSNTWWFKAYSIFFTRFNLKACCHYQSFPSKTWSKKTWSKSCVVTIKVFLMIGQRKGGNSMSTKSKMAPVNISQNDYLALSLCLLCITILRRRIRYRTRVGKRRTRYWFSYLYHNILLILYSILLIWPQPSQSILLSRHLSTLFYFWKPSCKFSFSRRFYHVFFVW